MPDGIQVLSQTEITNDEFLLAFPIPIIICLIVVSWAVFGVLIYSIRDGNIEEIVLCSIFLVVDIIMIGNSIFRIIDSKKEIHTPRYQYEVLIDDDADWEAVYQKYEIVDTKGKIYIIQDKEGE